MSCNCNNCKCNNGPDSPTNPPNKPNKSNKEFNVWDVILCIGWAFIALVAGGVLYGILLGK